MKSSNYYNTLISKKQLRNLLTWSFSNYDSMQACRLADELKHLGFKYSTQAGISISIEDLRIPFSKKEIIKRAKVEVTNNEKMYSTGKITDVDRFQRIIDIWDLTSQSLKNKIIHYFKNYDPLNSVYIMAFSGARGNLSQVRQLIGIRGLMANSDGELMNLAIRKNFREGLTVTDYLMSGYGARKGIVDTALKTANSGYLTRRLIDVVQDILIREKDCSTNHSFLVSITNSNYKKILGYVINKPVFELDTNNLIVNVNTQITFQLIKKLKEKKIKQLYIRSPLTCKLYRAICQKCYGWDLSNENFVDMGEAIGILAGQSIGEPGTQLTMRTFHTGGVFESKLRKRVGSPEAGIIRFSKKLKLKRVRTNRGDNVGLVQNQSVLFIIPKNKKRDIVKLQLSRNTLLFVKNNQYISKNNIIAQSPELERDIKTVIKPIISNYCGEVLFPKQSKKFLKTRSINVAFIR